MSTPFRLCPRHQAILPNTAKAYQANNHGENSDYVSGAKGRVTKYLYSVIIGTIQKKVSKSAMIGESR